MSVSKPFQTLFIKRSLLPVISAFCPPCLSCLDPPAALCHNEAAILAFLDTPTGILARGYAYRSCGARVYGISNGKQMIGAALVKGLDEEPACYDLQQFMIDQRFQNKGYGSEALRQILSVLCKEGRYNQVEVCVHRNNTAALHLYQNAGFQDTGYIDESVPDCRNLMYRFPVR